MTPDVDPKLRWNDLDGLVAALMRAHPAADPRGMTLDELRSHVIALPEFGDDATAGDPGQIETIRSIWWWGGNYDDSEI